MSMTDDDRTRLETVAVSVDKIEKALIGDAMNASAPPGLIQMVKDNTEDIQELKTNEKSRMRAIYGAVTTGIAGGAGGAWAAFKGYFGGGQ